MDERRMAEIKARCEAATPGEWKMHKYFPDWEKSPSAIYFDIPAVDIEKMGKVDAEFISHARADVPDLLAEVERQAAEIERFEERIATQKGVILNMLESERAQDAEIARLRAKLNEIRTLPGTAAEVGTMAGLIAADALKGGEA